VAIAKALGDALDEGSANLADRVLAKFIGEPELEQTFREILMQPLPIVDEDARETYARGVVTSALEKTIELEKNYLLAARTRADSAGDSETALEIARKLVDLDRELVLVKSKRS
jgi:hypothetical protein